MLITYAEVGDLAGVSPSDSFLMRTVKATDTWAKKSLGRQFARDTYELYPRGHGNQTIWLRESPIRRLIEIRIDPAGQFGDGTIVSDLTQFRFNPDPFDDNNKLTFGGSGCWGYHSSPGRWCWPFPEMPNAIKVVVEAGWWLPDDTDPDHVCDLPDDLRERLIERAVIRFKQGSDEEMQSERQGDRSFQKFQETDNRILKALRRYRR